MAISPAGLASGPTWADAICPAPKRHRTVASPRKNCFLKTKVPFMIPLARTIVVIRDNKRPRIMGTQRLLRFRQGILVLRSSAMRPCFPHSLLSARDLFVLRRLLRVRGGRSAEPGIDDWFRRPLAERVLTQFRPGDPQTARRDSPRLS